MTTPYSETTQGEWYQFDPNVHYYYDEQGQLHYYDPNTNQECDYQPQYNGQLTSENTYYHDKSMPQTYTPPIANTTVNYTDLASSRQPTPDVLLPCPEPTCNGENKPKSKFCEECGRPLGALSRSVTPATTGMTSLTKTFSQQQIGAYYPHDAPVERPPTAPVYSSLEGSTPIYAMSDPRHQAQLYYNGAQHQSLQDLYGASQQQQQQQQHQQQQQVEGMTRNMAYNSGYDQSSYQPPQAAIDPLGRARGCPIITFGFGGKILVTFPRTVTNYYSSTVKPQPGPIKIKQLKTMIPKTLFPGPILGDNKVGTKQKKKDVVLFMMDKLNTFENHKQGMTVGSLEYEQLQSKILLWQLVKVLVETEGSINDK